MAPVPFGAGSPSRSSSDLRSGVMLAYARWSTSTSKIVSGGAATSRTMVKLAIRGRLQKDPALRIGSLDRLDLAEDRQVIEAGEDDLEHPGAHRRVDVLRPDDLTDDLEGGLLPLPQRSLDFADQLRHLAPRLGDLRRRVAERTAVAGQHEVDLERLDLVEPAQELADRVGRVPVVEEEHRAAEQVVARDEQSALPLMQDHVGRGVAGRLVDLPVTEIRLHHDPRQKVTVRLDDPVDPCLGVAAAGLPVALQGLG